MSHLLKTAKSKDFFLHPTFRKEKPNAQLYGEGIGSGNQGMGDLRLTIESHWTKLEKNVNMHLQEEINNALLIFI